MELFMNYILDEIRLGTFISLLCAPVKSRRITLLFPTEATLTTQPTILVLSPEAEPEMKIHVSVIYHGSKCSQ